MCLCTQCESWVGNRSCRDWRLTTLAAPLDGGVLLSEIAEQKPLNSRVPGPEFYPEGTSVWKENLQKPAFGRPHFSCKKLWGLRCLHRTLKEEDALLPTLPENLRKSVASKRQVEGESEGLEVVPPPPLPPSRQQQLLPLNLLVHIQPPSESKPALSRFCTMLGPGTQAL